MIRHKNILIKIATVENDIYGCVKIFNPVIKPENDVFVYSEFIKIIDGKYNRLGVFIPEQEYIYVFGDYISNLKVGERFSILSNISNGRKTSKVIDIITPNLFLTQNSLYFIKDEKFQIQENRNENLNKIIP